MPQTFQGKAVTIVRPAQQGDAGFDASKDQVLVRNADGSQTVVLRADVKNA
jgi:hypothetical protein